MFVLYTDFNNDPYSLSGLDKVINNFNQFIEDQEAEILKQLLGIKLYDEFIEGLEEDYPEQKWLDLRDGARYEIGANTYEWKGLVTRTGAIVPYIYSMWLGVKWKSVSNIGVSVGKAENADMVSPATEISRGSAAFLGMIGSKKFCKKENTLYGFLTTNLTDYSSLLWTDYRTANQFDL